MTTQKEYNITPLAGYVLVKPYKEEQIGRFKISDNMNDKDSAGVVVAVGATYIYYEGNQAIRVNCPVKVGDIIIYQNIGTNAYMTFETGERLHIVRFHCDPYFNQILAIINHAK